MGLVWLKRILLALFIVLILGACSNENYVKDGEFVFEVDDFKESYEEVNDKNFPTNINAYKQLLSIENATRDEAVQFLDATYEIINYKEISRLRDSISKDEDNIDDIKMDDIFITYSEEEEGSISIMVIPILFEDE